MAACRAVGGWGNCFTKITPETDGNRVVTGDPSFQCAAGGDGRLALGIPAAVARPGYHWLLGRGSAPQWTALQGCCGSWADWLHEGQ